MIPKTHLLLGLALGWAALAPPSAHAWGEGHRNITRAAMDVENEALDGHYEALGIAPHQFWAAMMAWMPKQVKGCPDAIQTIRQLHARKFRLFTATTNSGLICRAKLAAGGGLEAAEEYEVNFVWNRQADWRKPPKNVAHKTTNGNPVRDQVGNPVWAYEVVTGGEGLNAEGGAKPWFEQAATRMYWNDYLLDGVWEAEPGQPPRAMQECLRHSFKPPWHAQVPLVRWLNPCQKPLTLAITGTLCLRATWPNSARLRRTVDVVLALVRTAQPSRQVLFKSTEQVRSNEDELVLNVGLTNRVEAGDQLVLSHRVTSSYGSDYAVDLVDKLDFKVIAP